MGWDEMLNLNKKFLDTLDLEKYLKYDVDVTEIMQAIEDDYEGSNILPKELEGCVFNFIDSFDFAEYLEERYNVRQYEKSMICLAKK